MIRKYRYGTPFNTEALTEKIETTEGVLPYGEVSQEEGFVFTYIMDEDDIVYGLGEANRGINKRGYCYISNCTDDPVHTEDKRSLYGAHNFIIVSGKTTFGLFFDYPSKLTLISDMTERIHSGYPAKMPIWISMCLKVRMLMIS